MGLIEIEGMHFYAWHGHYEVEQLVGNEFIVDVSIETELLAAAVSDNLDDALNYQAVYSLIKKEMAITSKLLEHLAHRILDSLYTKFPEIEKAKIKISKINPPMGGQIEKASITLTR